MDIIAERQGNMERTGMVASPPMATARATLEKLTRWQAVIDARLDTQMSLLEVLEEYLLVELRTHYYQGNIDPHFIGTLLDTVLQRMIDQTFLVYDEEQDAPYRWPDGADLGFASERRALVVQAVEGAATRFVEHYKDYLRRHWRMAAHDASLEDVIRQKLDEHLIAVDELFQPDRLVGLGVDEWRERIEALQDAWRRTSRLTALATASERRDLGALVRPQLPHWLRGLSPSDREWLWALERQAALAQALVDERVDGLGSLRAFARQLARDYVRNEGDMEVEPDSIRVQLQWRTVIGQPVHTYNLSELVAAGPVRPDAVSVFLVENGSMLRNQPLSPAFIGQLLANVDAPAGYLPALAERYARGDLKDAMLDGFVTRLQHSAFVARCAGQLSVTHHDHLRALWENAVDGVRVAGLVLPHGLKCADLLVFYRDEAGGGVSDLLLYAPGKPDGQEWIELPSLRALSGEVGAWTQHEAGREYLLQQLSPTERGQARAYFARVVEKPFSWDLGQDLRGTEAGFRACLQDAVSIGLANNLTQVALNESPRWYSALPLESRRNISGLSQALLVHQQVFDEQLVGYEVFMAFAKRTFADMIAPYLRSKGVLEPVDPATVFIDYRPGLAAEKKTASLLDLAIFGYEQNADIDDPAKGVRSSVGQDLGSVRSADLASYIRVAYLGERYAKHIRAGFLDATTPEYGKRREAYRYLLLARMDRDLRVAHGKRMLGAEALRWLTRQVTLLSDGRAVNSATHPGAAVTREGVIKLTFSGHVVSGAYVFTYFDPKASYWLYAPDAPDGILFRPYLAFSGSAAAQLHDYVLARVALNARAVVGKTLAALAAGTARVDTLRELNRLDDARDEFDAGIERAVTDVEDITTSRAEMIRNQVFKGLIFAAAPVCMVYPPFAVLLDIGLIAVNASQAIGRHVQGDTQDALGHWLVATWGTLFATLGAASMATALGHAASHLRLAVKPLPLSAQHLRSTSSVLAKESGPLVPALRLKPQQAAGRTPENLQRVTEEGIFFGTYRSPPNASQPQSTYYIASGGRYYQVKRDPYFGGLCLVDARRPGAFYKLPIRRMANGKWTHDKVGLRGGNGEVRNLGRIADLREAFPGHVFPDVARGALQGEAVVARFGEAVSDNYLFSLNAQTCVIASLYNPTTKVGAVIHFDHNIRALIERSLRDVTQRLGGTAQDIRATLVGGDWLTGADIGGRVRSAMRRQGLQPTWDHWSYSSCFGNTYGLSLDLGSGLASVFKTSRSQVERYYIPVLARAKKSTDPVSVRARGFMARVRSDPLIADVNGVVSTSQGRPATVAQIEAQAFPVVTLS
ncbi:MULTISPECIES: dermonecrotic toxin domain-containing protein [unclassified Pseudomonas]|uniref:dermonecrotic toxin domain-containing protein n=1 Tax=unclassified Pseudomonas TaxID=196821 RepID=UPI0039B78E5B